MDIKFTKSLEGTTVTAYKKGDTCENAELVFGDAQARYFVETGYAEIVGAAKEKAVVPKSTTPEP